MSDSISSSASRARDKHLNIRSLSVYLYLLNLCTHKRHCTHPAYCAHAYTLHSCCTIIFTEFEILIQFIQISSVDSNSNSIPNGLFLKFWLLRTYAAINSGNSGGPVFNEKRECVGIAFWQNSSILTLEGEWCFRFWKMIY